MTLAASLIMARKCKIHSRNGVDNFSSPNKVKHFLLVKKYCASHKNGKLSLPTFLNRYGVRNRKYSY